MRVWRMALCVLTFVGAGGPAWAARNVSCGSDVGLTMAVSGTTETTTPELDPLPVPPEYKLVSDGVGSYVNGTKTKGGTVSIIVQVSNCTYDFTANLSSVGRKLYVRAVNGSWTTATFMNIDRLGTVPVTAADASGQLTDPKAVVFCQDGMVVRDPSDPTKPLTDSNGVHDNYGGCWQDPSGRWYVRRAAGMTLQDSTNYRFNTSPLDGTGIMGGTCPGDARCATSFVRIYHPDASTWVVVPDDAVLEPPTPNPGAWVAAHLTPAVDTYVSLPFKIVITR